MSDKKIKEIIPTKEFKEQYIEKSISEYAEISYLEYAMSVVKGRAIPSVEDGLKPVHRRILYSMFKEGMVHTSVHKKSARVVGNVLGLYHPHGDQSVYEALVRQTQDYSVRYPLIDGQGNFGSRDGDGAAAMRYTEIKLSNITQLYLEEMKDQCVDFNPNYDGTEEEPQFLPARVPFILLNGNPGIGVGMATNMPSHNLKEVVSATIACLENENTTLDEVMNHIKGPDYATRGQIISSYEEIKKIYADGGGSFKIRSKYMIENEGSRNWKIIFYEIPYGVSGKKVVEEIAAHYAPEEKAKKDSKGKIKLSDKEIQLKTLYNNTIANFTDSSNKDNPMRIVIEPKNHKQNPEEIAHLLLATTSLESSIGSNFVVVGRDGRPTRKNLMEIIYEWIDFRLETVRRRTNYHLEKIASRLHILDGRKIVLSHIDEVIQIIKTSEDPKKDLMTKYGLSEIQAQDVLDLRLRQLGNLELQSIEKEMNELTKKQNELNRIISTEKNLKKQVIKELTSDMEKFSDERMTEIAEATKLDLAKLQEKASKITEEDVTVAISEKGWIKVVKGAKALEEINFKEGDTIDYLFHCKNTVTLGILDVDGKVYNASLNEIHKDGVPINTLAQMGSKFSRAFILNKDHKYLLTQDRGLGFIATGENLLTRMKAGKEMFKDVNVANILPIINLEEDATNYYVGIITTENRFLTYKVSEISEMGKSKGIVICGLVKEAKIKEIALLKEEKAEFIINGESEFILEAKDFKKLVKGRATKGNFLPIKEKNANIEFKI